jgi:hypothetical protein
MKKVIVLVGLVLMLSGLSYAAGPPIQPVPDVKGWWAADYILTQTGGSASGPGGMPFYQNVGVKRLGQVYINVTYQFGTKITGDYHTYMQSNWYVIPFEGWVYGNLFQIFTSTDNGPYFEKEEERYLNGIISTDSAGNKVIHGMGLVSRNSSLTFPYSWNNNLYTFTMRPYGGINDPLPPPNSTDNLSGPPACVSVCTSPGS